MPRWLESLVAFFKEKPVAYPKSVQVACDPNPPADEVSAYHFTLDGGAPVSSPTPQVTISVPAAGLHTFAVRAENLEGLSDPATLTKNFPAKPGKPINLRIL